MKSTNHCIVRYVHPLAFCLLAAVISLMVVPNSQVRAATNLDPLKIQFPYSTINAADFSTNETLTASAKARVFVFLSARCPCSNSHIAELNSLAEEFPEVQFLGVHSNQDENQTITETYFKNIGVKFKVLQDSKAQLADQFKAFKTPHAFLVNEKGIVVFQGGVSNSHDFPRATKKYLREALTEFKAGKEISTPVAKSLGCAISRDE